MTQTDCVRGGEVVFAAKVVQTQKRSLEASQKGVERSRDVYLII